MRIALLCFALTACASGQRTTAPQDWRPLITTPDFVAHYDDLSARYTDRGNFIVRVRAVPVRPAPYAWQEATYAIDCGTLKMAALDEESFTASGVSLGRRPPEVREPITVDKGTLLSTFMSEGCVKYRDRR
jgi:hypothetical protein